MQPRLIVLLNADAGRGNAGVAPKLERAFAALGHHATIEARPGSELTACATRAVRDGSAVVVAAGGDGTVSTVASALVGTDAALGVVPLGTLNHFARDLGIPLDLEGAVRATVMGQTTTVDVGEVNGRFFVNNSGVGAYPRLVLERESRQRRGQSKWVAQVEAALTVWYRYPTYRFALSDNGGRNGVVRTPFVFVGNNEYLLEGPRFGARRSLDRGRLHLCIAPRMTRPGAARMMFAAALGRLRNMDRFESHLMPEITIVAGGAAIPVSLDGEVIGLEPPLAYRIRPRALRVMTPPTSDRLLE